jgi:hypothetical protein
MVVQLQQSIIVVAFVHAVWCLLALLSVVSAAARAAQAVPSSTGAEHFFERCGCTIAAAHGCRGLWACLYCFHQM